MNILYDSAIGALRALYNRRIAGPPILDPAIHFPSCARFSSGWQGLRSEALAVAADLAEVPRFHEIMPQQADISAADQRDWRMLVVKAYGTTVETNAARCPLLSGLLCSAPEVLSATLSFLAPRKQVPEHRGPFRGVIRYYLALSVPRAADGAPGTVLSIDGTDYRMGDGEWLLWDDTYPHAVRNDTDAVRIALLLDVRRAAMPLDMQLLSGALIAAAGAAVRLRRLG